MLTHGVYVLLDLNIEDTDGKLIKDIPIRKSHSFTKNWSELLYSIYSQKVRSIYDIEGVLKTDACCKTYQATPIESVGLVQYDGGINCYAPQENSELGIIVGSDATAFSIDDYALGSAIIHGYNTGQLFYSKVDWLPMELESTYISTIMHRSFLNMSTSGVAVNEIGLYGKTTNGNNQNSTYMLLRDVIATETILPDQVMNVNIEFRTVI